MVKASGWRKRGEIAKETLESFLGSLGQLLQAGVARVLRVWLGLLGRHVGSEVRKARVAPLPFCRFSVLGWCGFFAENSCRLQLCRPTVEFRGAVI